MSFLRIKSVKKNGRSYKYLYRQTSIREGKKVRSKMEYLGSLNGDWHHPADDRHDPVKLQEEYMARQESHFNQERFLDETQAQSRGQSDKENEPPGAGGGSK